MFEVQRRANGEILHANPLGPFDIFKQFQCLDWRHRDGALGAAARQFDDDGGFSGGNTDRPTLQRLLEYVRAGEIDVRSTA